MATRVVMAAPRYPLKPTECMRNPAATAPPMPMATSISGPYVSPLRAFPASHPVANPTKTHDSRYIHSFLPGRAIREGQTRLALGENATGLGAYGKSSNLMKGGVKHL